MNKTWLTRTWPASEDSVEAWRAAGFDPVSAPLLEIEAVPHDPIPVDAVLIFTSKNGVDHSICGGQRAVCVGDATAAKARAAGYRNVVSVDGTSVQVKQWLRENISKTQLIYHMSGWHVRGSITEYLCRVGYDARRVKVYRSVPRPIWPEESISSVIFYSPLAAQVFTAMCESRNVSALTAVCISPSTARELTGLDLKAVHTAARPREDELIMAAKLA